MNNDSSRLRHTQKQESISEQQQREQANSAVKEFSSVEELLQHDVGETVVPPEIAVKLNQSIANIPKPEAKAWWRKFFARE